MELLQEKTVKIGEKDYPVKKTIRAMMEFEQLTGHSLNKMDTMGDVVIMFYCMFKAGGNKLTYDQFLDLIDDKPEAINNFFDAVMETGGKKEIPI